MRSGVALLLLGACGRLSFDPIDPALLDCELAAHAARVNFNSERAIIATGGAEPYTFATTKGSIDAAGVLAVEDEPGVATITVTDLAGCKATVDVAIGGDSLFYAGGNLPSSVPTDEVHRSANGIDWTLAGRLPARRYWGALVPFHDRLLWIGGSDGTVDRREVFESTDGVSWTQIGMLPFAASAFGFAVHEGQLWVVGGYSNADNVIVSSNGIDWTVVGSLPMDNHGGSLVSANGLLWYMGGHNGALFDWVLNSSDGVTWNQVGTLAVPREYHSALRVDNAVWVVGGQNIAPTPIADVTSTVDGTSWNPIPPLPVAHALGAVIRFNDRLWSFAGNNSAGVYSTAGGAWQIETTSFPGFRSAGLVAAFTPP